jgi:hypothetical protein
MKDADIRDATGATKREAAGYQETLVLTTLKHL